VFVFVFVYEYMCVCVYFFYFFCRPVVYPIPKWDERTYDPGFFQYTSEIVIAVLTSVGTLVTLALMVFVAVMHKRPAIHAAGMLFCEVILLGSLFLYSAVFAWMIYQNDGTCAVLPWLLCVGFVLIFGTMVVKTWRIRRVFINQKLKRVHITNLYLMMCVGSMLAVQLLPLVLWTAIDARSVVVVLVDTSRPVLNELQCTWSTVDIVFASLIVAYWSVIILTGLVLAFLIRNVAYTLYNESKLIAFAVYNLFFFFLLIVIIEVVPIEDAETVFIVRSLALILATFSTVLVLFVPKVYYVLNNVNREHGSQLFRKSTSLTSRTSCQSQGTGSSQTQLHTPCPTCGRRYLALDSSSTT
jgi:7 transmembrane sweet-taste receptor of 3 GCPR